MDKSVYTTLDCQIALDLLLTLNVYICAGQTWVSYSVSTYSVGDGVYIYNPLHVGYIPDTV